MKINRGLILSTFTIFSSPSFAESGWVDIATHPDGSVWSAKSGSLEFSKTKGETPIAIVVGRVSNSKTSKIDLYKWYVSGTDCAGEMGKVVSLNISGEYLFENDFVFGAGNIAAAMAESICGAAQYQIKAIKDKSL